MDLSPSVKRLLQIVFLDSVAYALIVPLLSPHIKKHGGDDVTIGILLAGMYICELLSSRVVNLFQHDSTFNLLFCLLVPTFTTLLLVLSSSFTLVILSRLIYSATSRVDVISKDIVTETEPVDSRDTSFQLIEIASVIGVIIGAISGACLFNSTSFTYNAMLATLCTSTAMVLLDKVEETTYTPKPTPEPIMDILNTNLNYLKEFKTHSDQWETILLKVLYITSFTIFFTKYAFLVTSNYDTGVIVLGYTVAYQEMLNFAFHNFAPFVKQYFFDGFQHVFILSLVAVVGLFYSPSYECYLIVFIPMMGSYRLVLELIDDCLKLKGEDGICKGIGTVTHCIGFLVPVLYGVVSQFCSLVIFKLVAILPAVLCLCLYAKRLIWEMRNLDAQKRD